MRRKARPAWYGLKTALAHIILWFLGRGFSATAARDSRIQEELAEWADGTGILLKIEPRGPAVSLQKRGKRLQFMGFRESGAANIAIFFKNLDAALLVLTGQIGIARAFAEHRFTARGDIAMAMSVVRCMTLVEAYLFPRFMTRKIMSRVPKKQVGSLRIYLAALLGA